MQQHRRSSSLVHFSAERSRPSRPARTSTLAMHELRSKADELERLLAASKIGSPAHRTSPPRVRRDGSETSDRTDEAFGEIPLGLRPSDDDLLLDMVSNLQLNMTQSISGSARGRLYERYTQRRDGKLREERGSAEWARKKEAMKTMEDFLEETWALMKAQSGDPADEKNSFLQRPRCLRKQMCFNNRSAKKIRKQRCKENLDEHAPYVRKSLHRTAIDESGKSYGSGKLLSCKTTEYSSTSQNSRALVPRFPKATYSGFRKQKSQPENSLKQMAGESSDLRKENMKPLEKVRNIAGHSDAGTFSRSRSTLAGLDVFKEDKQPKFRHMRNRSVALGELKELTQLHFDSSSLALSRSPKDQSENTVCRKIQVRGGPKPFLRRDGGIGPGVGGSIPNRTLPKAHESCSKRDSDEDLVDQQEYSQDMIGNVDVEFERRWSKSGDSVFPAEVNNEELSSKESGSSNDIKCVAENYFHAGLLSNIHSSFPSENKASDTDTSVQSRRYDPSTRNTHHVDPMREGDATQVRKKWGSVERPNFGTNDLDQPFKDVAKVFKKLLKFGRKSKNAERKMNYPLSASTSSGGGDDREDGSYQGKQSFQLTKSRKVYSNVALDEGSIFSKQGPLISFRSFNGRGTEAKA